MREGGPGSGPPSLELPLRPHPPRSTLFGVARDGAAVDELERSYRETQERMSDPAVYNDHREAAEVGRRLKELEEPYRLAQEWQQASTDLEAARADGDLKELVPELEQRHRTSSRRS